jgi:hypothetical protein
MLIVLSEVRIDDGAINSAVRQDARQCLAPAAWSQTAPSGFFFAGCAMTATHVTSDVFGDRELPADQGFDLLNWVRVWVDLGKSGTVGESALRPVARKGM